MIKDYQLNVFPQVTFCFVIQRIDERFLELAEKFEVQLNIMLRKKEKIVKQLKRKDDRLRSISKVRYTLMFNILLSHAIYNKVSFV
jgi:hypothetical protein